jgi:predicted metal-dependent hydrolase
MFLFSFYKQFTNTSIAPVFSKKLGRRDYLKHKESARALVAERVLHFNKIYQHSYNKIAIRNQKTRWGSCSSKGNLNFNYKILFLPEALRDYVIVHELCHLKEFNHSKKFWDLVAVAIPDHSEVRKELKSHGFGLVW